MRAAKSCEDPTTVKLLIKAGAVDLIDNEGKSALILAAESGHADVIIALLDAGFDPNVHDKLGKRALDYARTNPKLLGSDALKRLEKLSK